MKSRLELKVVAASLALAVTSGQAIAANKFGDHGNLVLTTVIPSAMAAITRESSPLKETTPGGEFGAKSNEGTAPDPNHPARISSGLLLAAADRLDNPATAFPPSNGKDTAAAGFSHPAGSPSSAMAAGTVPESREPRNWAIVLAGLLGVGAIAHRRMPL
ncbi:MAG: hypothetical protein HY066_04845 [Betaproteobacteria bacterium]|nr:hypothetical protein [Betaproteobacteria bacterium]